MNILLFLFILTTILKPAWGGLRGSFRIYVLDKNNNMYGLEEDLYDPEKGPGFDSFGDSVAGYVQASDINKVKEDLLNRRVEYGDVLIYAILRGPFMYQVHSYGYPFDAYSIQDYENPSDIILNYKDEGGFIDNMKKAGHPKKGFYGEHDKLRIFTYTNRRLLIGIPR